MPAASRPARWRYRSRNCVMAAGKRPRPGRRRGAPAVCQRAAWRAMRQSQGPPRPRPAPPRQSATPFRAATGKQQLPEAPFAVLPAADPRRRCRAGASSGLSPGTCAAAAGPAGRAAQIRILLHHRSQRFRQILALEQPLAGEHLIQHHAERPDVGALIDNLPARLLRAHVCRRAEDHSHLRARR